MTYNEILETIIKELNKNEYSFFGRKLEIDEHTKLYQVELDRFDAVEFIESIEVFSNLNLRSIEIDCLSTIQELAEIIEEKEQNEIKR